MSGGTDRTPIEVPGDEWVGFPGGELEGKRPKALCSACRDALKREAAGAIRTVSRTRNSRLLCFQCYRAELDRERALVAAARLSTASEARFQSQLPFEPVNRGRLEFLKVERAEAREHAARGVGQFVDKRRQAQIAARRALQHVAAGLQTRRLPPAAVASAIDAAVHAAELQLPDAWLPFVVSR
jgi:hypothetical protein